MEGITLTGPILRLALLVNLLKLGEDSDDNYNHHSDRNSRYQSSLYCIERILHSMSPFLTFLTNPKGSANSLLLP